MREIFSHIEKQDIATVITLVSAVVFTYAAVWFVYLIK